MRRSCRDYTQVFYGTLTVAAEIKMPCKKWQPGVKGHVEEPPEEYVTPGGYELEKILNRGCVVYTRVNQGFLETARDKLKLKELGITHILNAAEGTWNCVDTGAGYYSDLDVVYYGLVAEDTTTFDLSQYFYTAAEFIHKTLSEPQNKLLVHCVMGRSRSASLFLAFLMIRRRMTLVDAIEAVKSRRRIIPNWGFLKQLRELDMKLQEEGSAGAEHCED
uniref:Dual specificity protein phosphatase n=1 Tax=Knipowitschia caucasica TaxID=637954 RepID=A0AAV2LHB1_KNICA